MKHTYRLFAWVAALVLVLTGPLATVRAANAAPIPVLTTPALSAEDTAANPSFSFQAAPQSPEIAAAGNPFPAVIPVTTSAAGAHSVRTADLDNDGDQDVIVAARGNGQVVWHENLGTTPPSFAARPLITADGSYMAVAADINRDGWTDIVVTAVGLVKPSSAGPDANGDTAAGTGKVFWLQNQLATGQGFAPRPIADGLNYPVAVHAVDLNRDNKLDIVAATRDDGRVLWFENNGDGSGFAARVAGQNLSSSVAVHAGDIDGDGRIDIVAAAEDTNQIVWLRNNGAQPPSFEQRTVSSGPPPPQGQDFAKAVFAADVDDDGDLDIVFASEEQNTIGWFENNGRGASFSQRVIATDMLHAKSVYVEDIDWDGDLDILATASENGIVALYENRRGKPAIFVPYVINGAARGAHSVTAADMDGDGDLDVLSASRDDNSVLLYPNLASHRTALFDTQTQYVVSTYGEPRMAAGVDLDNDGDQDVISVADQVVAWHRNDGGLPPNFTRFVISQGLEGGRWIHAADVDGDGDQDLFAADTTANRLIWYETQLSAPGAVPSFVERTIDDRAEGVRDVHTADLDVDGDLDLYIASGVGDIVAWYEQKRTPAVTFEERIVATPRYPRSSFAADLNLDGRLDLMSASAEDNMVAWYENRGGTPPGWLVREQTRAMDGARHIYASDLDGDGDIDMLAGAERSNTIAWYENRRGNPPGFVEHIVSRTAAGVHAVVTGDADRDGDLDVFAALESGERVVWYENDGAAVPNFTEHLIAANFRVAHSIALSDLDSDGDLDAIATSRAGGQVAWFENVGGQYNVSQSGPQAGIGSNQVLLGLVFFHRGRPGDVPLRVNALTLRFTTNGGRPLTPAEAGALYSGLSVYQDSNFSGTFDPQDVLLSSADSLNVDANGQLLVDLPSSQPGVLVGAGSGARYFVTAATLSNLCLTGNNVVVTHIANAMTVANQQTGYRMSGEYMRSIDVLGAPQDTTQTLVIINEIMADNTRTLEDPNEPVEFPDWIELYNPAPVPVNLGGMFLSDDPADSQSYRIPDGVVIGANSYLVFIADGEPEQGPLHTNFRLSKGGESVTLIDKAARSFRLLDQVEYDGLAADISYGRFPNSSGAWRVLGAATPGSFNLDQPLIIQAHAYAPIIANGTGCR
jgi:WD40 repeat protein